MLRPRDIRQFGDFQTPPLLADAVCGLLARRGVDARVILEPTCGRGAFLAAAHRAFPATQRLIGFDINPVHVAEAAALDVADIAVGDFFTVDWSAVLNSERSPWLILGNPPWVTNAALSSLNSNNLPVKANFQQMRGVDAITGKANFDISEWMLLQQLAWLRERSGWIAMLVKTSVARKVLRHAWKTGETTGTASIYRIDAQQHFDAAVEACLLILPVNIGPPSSDCDVFDSLSDDRPIGTIGYRDGMVIADLPRYLAGRELIAPDAGLVWRSGIKHDCSKVIELIRRGGVLRNGHGEAVAIEEPLLFPMMKSSDVAGGRLRTDRFMLVPQSRSGEDTTLIATRYPQTWAYLQRHAEALDRRKSIIYRSRPRFSLFGIGDYSFAPWKVAVAGFYGNPVFTKVGPVDGRPVVMDDTVYFLPCRTEAAADLFTSMLNTDQYVSLMRAMMFPGDKRPVTADLLRRISLRGIADRLGKVADFDYHVADRVGQATLF